MIFCFCLHIARPTKGKQLNNDNIGYFRGQLRKAGLQKNTRENEYFYHRNMFFIISNNNYNLNILAKASETGCSVLSKSSGRYLNRFSRIGKGF